MAPYGVQQIRFQVILQIYIYIYSPTYSTASFYYTTRRAQSTHKDTQMHLARMVSFNIGRHGHLGIHYRNN